MTATPPLARRLTGALLLAILGFAAPAQAVIYGRTITVDGDMSDWKTAPDITVNQDQSSTDAQGSAGFCTPPVADLDCTVQATGRDLERFAYTYDNNNLYMFVERYASTSNANDWWFYLDLDPDTITPADSRMDAGDKVLHVSWTGSNGRTIRTIYDYVPADAINGDPLVNPIGGQGDGWDMPGTITGRNQLDPNNNPLIGGSTSGPQDGVEMETLIAWNLLKPGATGPFSVGFHIASSNSTNIPQQLDDNMDGPGGGAVLQFSDPQVTKTGALQGASGIAITWNIEVFNAGPDPALNVVLQDDCAAMVGNRPLEVGESFAYSPTTAIPSSGTYEPGTVAPYGNGIWEIPSIAVGATETLMLDCVVTVEDPISITNTATIVDAATPDTDAGNNSDANDVPIIIVPQPQLTILKSSTVIYNPVNGFSNPKRIPGACIVYTVQVINHGRGEAEDNEITDALPTGLTLFTGSFAADLSALPDECGGTTVAGDPLDFVPGASGVTYTFGGLGDGGDGLEFYNASDTLITPTILGFDPNVAKIVVKPAGAMKGQSQDPNAGQYEFWFRYITRID